VTVGLGVHPVEHGAARDAKLAIMEAAEAVFATNGYAGSTTRQIAEEAGVNLALIHYHFSSKEKLYELVLSRRANDLNAARMVLLKAAVSSDAGPALESVIDALVRPAIEYSDTLRSAGQNFARMIDQLASATDELSVRLLSELFDELAQEAIDALQKSVPHLQRSDAVTAYLFTLSICNQLMARQDRSSKLCKGPPVDVEPQALIRKVVSFLVAGINTMVAEAG